MNVQTRISDLEATRATKAERMSQINSSAANEQRTKTEDERKEFDALKSDIERLDADLADERVLLEVQSKTSTPVNGRDSVNGSRARDGVTRINGTNRPKGHGFSCIIQALASAHIAKMDPAVLARRAWPDWPEIAKEIEFMQWQRANGGDIHKAAAGAATTTSTSWAGPLAQIMPSTTEFIELLRPQTILGRISGFVPVPWNTRVPRQDSAGAANWVGEGVSKPVTVMSFSSVDFPLYTMSKICALQKQLVAISNPSALPIVQREMLRQLIEFSDTQLLLSTVALSAGVNPASLTNGVTGTAASGTAEANMRQDLRALLASFSAANYPLTEVVLVTSEDIMFRLATAVNSLGARSFPDLGITGGSIFGVPAVASNSVTEEQIVGIHAPSVLVGSDNQLEVSISEEATLQMDDAPTSPPTSATVLESLWQTNRIGIRVEQFQGWLKSRTTAVNRIHTIAYV